MHAADLLSQTEIDALLSNSAPVSTATAAPFVHDAPATEPESRVSTLDERLGQTEQITHRFAGLWARALRDLVGVPIELGIAHRSATHYATCQANIMRLPHQEAILYSALGAPILLAMEAQLVTVVVERFFGGSGRYPLSAAPAAITSGERQLARQLFRKACECLHKAWLSTAYLEFRPCYSETEDDGLVCDHLMEADEAVVMSELSLQLDQFAGKLYVMTPCSIFDSIQAPPA